MSRKEEKSQFDLPAGSPPPGEPVFLVVGKIRRSHGVHGEMQMEVWTDFPERLVQGKTVFIGESKKTAKIQSLRWHNQLMLISFQGCTDPDNASDFRNKFVYVRTDEIPTLAPGEYYHHQLIGLKVIDEAGDAVGEVTDLLETGSNDVLVVQTEPGKDILLPIIDEVILDIDLATSEIRVHLLPGLLP